MAQPNLQLGFDSSTTYVTVTITIDTGDRLYLLSDGLYEFPAASGELWGQGRLETTIQTLGQQPLETVITETIAEAVRWQGHEQFPDDVALMCVEIAI